MKSYNKLYVAVLATFALVVGSSSSVNAGWFGASFGTQPSVTLFGQTLTVPVPSVVLGGAAGTSVSGNVSSDGANISLPFVKVGIKSPRVTVGVKGSKINVCTAGVHKASSPKKKAKKAKK
jgi:hypothetical protein